MALLLDWYDEERMVTYSGAYVRVVEVIAQYDIEQASIRAAVYSSEEARKMRAKPLTRELMLHIDNNSDPPFNKTLGSDSDEEAICPRLIAYTLLKSLPEFKNAKDV